MKYTFELECTGQQIVSLVRSLQYWYNTKTYKQSIFIESWRCDRGYCDEDNELMANFKTHCVWFIYLLGSWCCLLGIVRALFLEQRQTVLCTPVKVMYRQQLINKRFVKKGMKGGRCGYRYLVVQWCVLFCHIYCYYWRVTCHLQSFDHQLCLCTIIIV